MVSRNWKPPGTGGPLTVADPQRMMATAKATVAPRHRRDKPRHLKGRLLVSPDAVVFTAQGVRFEHTEPTITLVKGSLLLQDKSTEVHVAVPIARRHRLKRALRESDVKVSER